MSEVLDPTILSSALIDSEVYKRAEAVAANPTLHSELEDDTIAHQIEKMHAIDDRLGADLLREFIVDSIAGQVCLRALMDDGQGRSEFQIAGEVCRIAKSLASVAILNNIPELKNFSERGKWFEYGAGFWFPEGVTYPCPTIDGSGEDEFRIVRDKNGSMVHIPSAHTFWLLSFTKGVLPSNVPSYLTLLAPPFVLRGGHIVAQSQPQYYVQADKSFDEAHVEPKVLVGV